MALKYFERLVNTMAPVLTASSVEEGRAILEARSDEVAVLITDQRMPTANGNELLRYARESHPNIVRMLTTAYSELGEAVEAINTGEIYRYITKPWDLELLRTDLRNALELSNLRSERDEMLSEKLAVQQQQLLAGRVAQLAPVCAGFVRLDYEAAVHSFVQAARAAGCVIPAIDWGRLDHAELAQSEAQRAVAIGQALRTAQTGMSVWADAAQAGAALAQALPGQVELRGGKLVVLDRTVFTALLEADGGAVPTAQQAVWLAWLLQWNRPVGVQSVDGGWALEFDALAAPEGWMADGITRLIEGAQPV
jgi:two-component system probable response regulator PhcQ